MPNFIAEWYGVRLYPSAAGASAAVDLLREKRCPFLSDALEAPIACIKNPNSSGVCTITTTRAEVRDWITCPYRVLERGIIQEVTRKVFSDRREELPGFMGRLPWFPTGSARRGFPISLTASFGGYGNSMAIRNPTALGRVGAAMRWREALARSGEIAR